MSAYSDLVIADGAVFYLRLGESSGTSAVDAKGGTSWTYKNGPTLGVAGAIAGDADTAITVNGTTNFKSVNLADVPMTATDNITLEAWVNPETQNDGPLGCIVAIGGGNGYAIVVNTSNYPRGFAGGGSGLTDAPASPLTTGVWHHLVLKRASGTWSLWVNGTRADPGTNNTSAPSTPTSKSCIGANQDANWFFKGSIDEVAGYNTALSDATILSHYEAGIQPDYLPIIRMGGRKARIAVSQPGETIYLT